MKLVPLFYLFLTILISMSSCNMFSPLEFKRDSLDRCKGLNDAGKYEEAMKECMKVLEMDPDNLEANLEYADASFSYLGIDIVSISDVFLKPEQGTNSIVSLAESILARGFISLENKTNSLEVLEKAVDAFDRYGTVFKSEYPGKKGEQIAAFYSMLARLCYLSIIMGYADLQSPSPDGLIRKDDICTDDSCNIFICDKGDACGGMPDSDAKRAGELIRNMKDELSLIGLGDVQKAIDLFTSILVFDPNDPFGPKKTIDEIEGFDAAIGRQLLFEICD